MTYQQLRRNIWGLYQTPGATARRGGAERETDEVRALDLGFNAREWLDAEPTVDVAQRDRFLKDAGTLGL